MQNVCHSMTLHEAVRILAAALAVAMTNTF
jgi:hypothetical protein